MNSFSVANFKFCLDIFKELKKKEKGNVFYSPLSISAAMGMLLLGLGGNSASQVKKVLHYDEVAKIKRPSVKESPRSSPALVCNKRGEFHSQFHTLLEEINKPNDDYSLAIANRLYGSQKFPFLQSYLVCVEKLYQASPESMDFSQAPEECREKINSWVEDQTNGKIKELFPVGTIATSTILVLVNAIYFKGKWAMEFKRENTKKALFKINKDTSKSVQMMKQTGFFNFGYIQECQVKILELPYTNNHLSMFVLLPAETDGLEKLEEQLTSEKLMEWMNPENMTKKELVLHFPRFKLEQTYSLVSTLKAMGIRDIFDAQSADFSGMTTHKGLSVSRIIHKSFVEVNEEGTEAAAATGVGVKLSSSLTEEFNCNQPLLFFIREKKSQNFLFFGRVIDP